jgi:glycerol-3-phosphate dehydrogenase
MKSRTEALGTVETEPFDVCVIGGGATGAGCALDAQLRGLGTALIEANDFASGTSSRSTKMVHGGVRYLEQAVRQLDIAEYKVVKRALRERIHMLRNGPYLSGSRQFITPCYRWSEIPYYGAGLKLYDWIAGQAGLAASEFLSRDDVMRRIPALNRQRLRGGVAYTDGQFDDARYNVALVLTLAEAGGAAANYTRVVEFDRRADGKIAAAQVQDQISGRRFAVRAKCFVNATGPFADSIRQLATRSAPRRMRLSKGVHILLPLGVLWPDASALDGSDALLIPKTEDGRVLFAIPWMGRLLVGTTDVEVDQAEHLSVTKAEVEYLLRHLNRYLASPVRAREIVSAFAGVRPLVSAAGSERGATKELARDHVVEVDPASGLITIMGGKWTTYRAMAQDTVDAVERHLERKPAVCRTANHALVGSDGSMPDSPQSLAREFGISEASAGHLRAKFGARAVDVMALARANPDLRAPLVDGLAPLKAEVVFCARNEMAISIEDILARRIGLEFYGWRESVAAAPRVAELLAGELGWPSEMKDRAIQQYIGRIEHFIEQSGAVSAA